LLHYATKVAKITNMNELNTTVSVLISSIGNTLRAKRTAFTCSAITPPKVNRFGQNLEHCEPNVGCWPWQILEAIRS